MQQKVHPEVLKTSQRPRQSHVGLSENWGLGFRVQGLGLGVSDLGVLIIRILLFRVLH